MPRGRRNRRAPKKARAKRTHTIIDFTIRTRVPNGKVPTIKDPRAWIDYIDARHFPNEEELISVNIRLPARVMARARPAAYLSGWSWA